MTDFIDSFLAKVGISGSSSKALQFVIGLGLVAFSLVKYSNQYAALYIIGILIGAFFILKAIQ